MGNTCLTSRISDVPTSLCLRRLTVLLVDGHHRLAQRTADPDAGNLVSLRELRAAMHQRCLPR